MKPAMRNKLWGALTLLCANFVLDGVATAAPVPAFPGAEGFGALASGGSGGETNIVSHLNDSGPGSFREAVSQRHRIVTFSVSGTVRLKSNVSVASDVTIAGESAAGITLYGHSVSFSGSSNIVVRYVRFREGIGGDRGKCSVNIAGGANMIFDHVSIEWGRWDCLGLTQGSHDITIQNSIIGEAIDPQRFGALVDSVNNVTLSHNLWIHNHSRNPKAKGTIQYINNVVYNWGVTGLVGGHSGADHQLDCIGNYFIKGPSSNDRFLGMFTATDKVFQSGNLADLDRDGSLNGREAVEKDFSDSGGGPTFVTNSFLQPPIPVTVESAEAAYQKVIAGAGCSLHRDAVDKRLIADVQSLGKRGRIVHDEKEVGGGD
jgi:pectate lyase